MCALRKRKKKKTREGFGVFAILKRRKVFTAGVLDPTRFNRFIALDQSKAN